MILILGRLNKSTSFNYIKEVVEDRSLKDYKRIYNRESSYILKNGSVVCENGDEKMFYNMTRFITLNSSIIIDVFTPGTFRFRHVGRKDTDYNGRLQELHNEVYKIAEYLDVEIVDLSIKQ